MRKFWALLLAGAVGAGTVPALAAEQSLTGSWMLEIVSPQGTRTPTMVLQQSGHEVTGTYRTARGTEVPVKGMLHGQDFSLTVRIRNESEELVIEYKGQLQPDGALKGKALMGTRGEATFTGKRGS